MNLYRIKIYKPGKTAPRYVVVTAADILQAEYYAVDKLILSSRTPIENHLKMNYIPLVKSLERTARVSRFEFQSRMLMPDRAPITVEIRQDNDVKSQAAIYVHNHDQSIFDLWPYTRYLEQEQKRRDVEPTFFTENDLVYFSSVAGKKFKSPTSKFIAIGEELTKRGVYAKTGYWAELMRQFGFTTEFRNDWQFRKMIRYYTWARVFPGKKSHDVFFTIGVGSRHDEVEGQVSGLVYKLDCRRDRLADHEQKIFDDYLANHVPEARLITIEAAEFGSLDWDRLAERTRDFLNAYDDHFWTVRRLLEGGYKDHQKAIARVCWNTNGWMFPSGPEGKSVSPARTQEKERGYGYEEWLFNTTKQIDGYHYSFLQAFHNKGDHLGKKLDIRLYAFHNTGRGTNQYWIGRIRNIEVLTARQSREALDEYKVRGWYDEMIEQLRQYKIPGFSFIDVKENEMFNIRFQVDSEAVVRYSLPIPINKNENIGNKHYTLMEMKTTESTSRKDPFDGCDQEESVDDTPLETTINASHQGHERTMKLLHRDIQKKIRRQLMTEFEGTSRIVQKEYETDYGTSIDLVVKDTDGSLTLYEIKTGITPILCIREALGQLIEYCFYPHQRLGSRLIIVGPHLVDPAVKAYMAHLRSELKIDLYYQGFNLDSGVLEPEQV